MLPIGVEPAPAALRRLAHLQRMNNEVVRALGRHLALTHVAAHGNVQQETPVLDGPGTGGHDVTHDGTPIDIPHKASTAGAAASGGRRGAGAAPGKVEADGSGRHVRDVGRADEVLGGVLGGVVAPVEAGMVNAVAIPGFGEVDLALVGPVEGLARQCPECGPHALGAGERQPRGDAAVGTP